MKIHTRRRKKMVNHGRWRKYSAALIDPREQFAIGVSHVHKLPNQTVAFDVDIATHLKLRARQAQWIQGVRLYSLSAEGRAKIRLHVRCELGIDLDFDHFPPDLVLSPQVTDATIAIDEFRIEHISKVGGEVAQQVTRLTRGILEKKIAAKEEKLVAKINRQFEKHQDYLRWSVAEAIASPWAGQVKDALPISVREALEHEGLPASRP